MSAGAPITLRGSIASRAATGPRLASRAADRIAAETGQSIHTRTGSAAFVRAFETPAGSAFDLLVQVDALLERAGVPAELRLFTGSASRLEAARLAASELVEVGGGPTLEAEPALVAPVDDWGAWISDCVGGGLTPDESTGGGSAGFEHEAQESAGAGAVPALSASADHVLRVLDRSHGDVPEPIMGRIRAMLGRGSPLDPAQQARFSQAMDHDLSHVRVHVGGPAADAARAISARAFTVGADVFFGTSEYAPGTTEGDRLLAHELTHVVQHDEGRLPSSGGVSSPTDPAEQEAYANEGRVVGVLETGSVSPLDPLDFDQQVVLLPLLGSGADPEVSESGTQGQADLSASCTNDAGAFRQVEEEQGTVQNGAIAQEEINTGCTTPTVESTTGTPDLLTIAPPSGASNEGVTTLLHLLDAYAERARGLPPNSEDRRSDLETLFSSLLLPALVALQNPSTLPDDSGMQRLSFVVDGRSYALMVAVAEIQHLITIFQSIRPVPASQTLEGFAENFNSRFDDVLPAFGATLPQAADRSSGTGIEGRSRPTPFTMTQDLARQLFTNRQIEHLSCYFEDGLIPERLFNGDEPNLMSAAQRILLSAHILANGRYPDGMYVQRVHAPNCGHWVQLVYHYAGVTANNQTGGVEGTTDHTGGVVLGSGEHTEVEAGGRSHDISGRVRRAELVRDEKWNVYIASVGESARKRAMEEWRDAVRYLTDMQEHPERYFQPLPLTSVELEGLQPGDWLYYFNNNRSRGGQHSVIFARWLTAESQQHDGVTYRQAEMFSQGSPDRGGRIHTEWIGTNQRIRDLPNEYGNDVTVLPLTRVSRVPPDSDPAHTDVIVRTTFGAGVTVGLSDDNRVVLARELPGRRPTRDDPRVEDLAKQVVLWLKPVNLAHLDALSWHITPGQRYTLLALNQEATDLDTLVRLNERLWQLRANLTLIEGRTQNRLARLERSGRAQASAWVGAVESYKPALSLALEAVLGLPDVRALPGGPSNSSTEERGRPDEASEDSQGAAEPDAGVSSVEQLKSLYGHLEVLLRDLQSARSRDRTTPAPDLSGDASGLVVFAREVLDEVGQVSNASKSIRQHLKGNGVQRAQLQQYNSLARTLVRAANNYKSKVGKELGKIPYITVHGGGGGESNATTGRLTEVRPRISDDDWSNFRLGLSNRL